MNDAESCVRAAASLLIDAFSRHDTRTYFASFAEDASFIFHNLDRVLRSRAAYQTEWHLWETRDGFHVLGCNSSDQCVQMAGDVAIFTHAVETVISSAGETITQRERETIVFRRENGHWIAFHEHLSVLPA
jgi:ketosteroid isomerase-like protein